MLLPKTKTVRYLGITFLSDAKHIRHVDDIILKATKAAYAIRYILRSQKGVSLSVRKLC